MTDNHNQYNEFKDIEKKVTYFVQGKHGRIGIIVPDHKIDEQEWRKLNEEIAELFYHNADRLKARNE